jgi:hypothetical protein
VTDVAIPGSLDTIAFLKFALNAKVKTGIAARESQMQRTSTMAEDPIEQLFSEWFMDIQEHRDQCVEPLRVKPKNDGQAYVYMMQHDKCFKIGVAKNVDHRLSEVAAKMPYELKIVAICWYPTRFAAYESESEWHRRFHSKRLGGEWFKLNSHDVAVFSLLSWLRFGQNLMESGQKFPISSEFIERLPEIDAVIEWLSKLEVAMCKSVMPTSPQDDTEPNPFDEKRRK